MIRNFWKNRNIRNIIGVFICLSICLLVFSSGQAQTGIERKIPITKTAEKHIEPNKKWDGTYDLTIGVNSPYHEEAGIRKTNILFICDLSSSMYSYRSDHEAAIKELITSLKENSRMDAEYSMVGFAGEFDEGAYTDAVLMSDWKKLDTDQKISEFAAAIMKEYDIGGLTNYEAGLMYAKQQLKKISDARKGEAETIVIFLTDGEPNIFYDENGLTDYYDYQTAYEKALKQAADIQADYFYGIFFGTNWVVIPDPSKTNLQIVEDVVNTANVSVESKTYHAQNAEDLINHLKNIASRIEGIEIHNVTIQDTLHYFTQFVECDARLTLQILDSDGNMVAVSDPGECETSLTFIDNNKTITMRAFRKDERVIINFDPAEYVLNHNYSYQLTMHVEPSAAAYSYYSKHYEYPHTADDNTGIHSLQDGFFANQEAYLHCFYKDSETNEEKELFLMYPKPVLQIKLNECGELPKTGFSALRPTPLTSQPKNLTYSYTGLTLQIPSLDVNTSIVTVPFTDDGYPVEWLGDQAGMLDGFAKPGEGYSLLTGHNHLNTMEAGPFAMLSALQKNDLIIVQNSRHKSLYFHVYDNRLIKPDDMAEITSMAKKEPDSLVLVTCENESADGIYLNRRVIFAKPD